MRLKTLLPSFLLLNCAAANDVSSNNEASFKKIRRTDTDKCPSDVIHKNRTCTTPWSTYVGKDPLYSSEIVIECGDCVQFDLSQEQNITLNGGLFVKGKLVFPRGTKTSIETPHVRVLDEGYVEGHEGIFRFNDDFRDFPVTAKGTPQRALSKLPPGCPKNGVILSESFSTPDSIVPYQRYQRDKSVFASFTHKLGYRPGGFVAVNDRTSSLQGLVMSLKHLNPCFDEGEQYVLTAKIRLRKPGVARKTPTECASSGKGCVVVRTVVKTAGNIMFGRDKYEEKASFETAYGEWWEINASFSFWSFGRFGELASDNLYHNLSFEGPGPGVILDIDDIMIRTEDAVIDKVKPSPKTKPPPKKSPPSAKGCSNLVYNGSFDSGSVSPWSNPKGDELKLVTGANGSALAARTGNPMQYINGGCFRAGTLYEASLKYKFKKSNGKIIQCSSDCPELILRISRGKKLKYMTIAPSAGPSDTSDGWFEMYGTFMVDDKDFNADSTFRISFIGIGEGQGVVIDDVAIREKPLECTRNLVLNSNSNRGYQGFWKLTGQGKIEDFYTSNSKAIRLSKRKESSDGLSYEANRWVDLRCFTPGSILEFSIDMKLFDRGTNNTAWCDISTSVVDRACPSLRIIGYDAKSKKRTPFFQLIYSNAYKTLWDRRTFNRLSASVTVPAWVTTHFGKLQVSIGKDVDSKKDIVVDNFSIRAVTGGGNLISPAPPFISPAPPTRRSAPTPAPTMLTIPLGKKNDCPKKGHSVIVSDTTRAFSVSDGLCTLTKVYTETGGNVVDVVPIARSYDGNEWEAAGGGFAARVFSASKIKCKSETCRMSLPALGKGEKYVLTSHKYEGIGRKDAIARFLETSTFGIRTSDVNNWELPNKGIWIMQQMSLPVTSHREYWRSRANPRWQLSQTIGKSTSPCSKFSRWRKFTLTTKDLRVRDSPVSGEVFIKNTTLAIDADGKAVPSGPYKIVVDGRVRTVVKDIEWEYPLTRNRFPTWDPEFGYFICSAPYDSVGGQLHLRTKPYKGNPDGDCQRVSTGNPALRFNKLPRKLLRLSGNSLKTLRNDMYLLQTELSGELCNSLPPHAEDSDPAVYALHPTIGLVQWDPSLSLEQNTMDSPTRDGGGSIVRATGGTTACFNAPRTFTNAAKCILSNQDTACGPASSTTGSTIVCGSPGEVASDPRLGPEYDVASDVKRDTTDPEDLARQRETVWTMVALFSQDQLRQRMAWALSQIVALAKESVTVQDTDTEAFLQFYDIFVRNAFRNYFDVLREISYSPLMAENLSYLESKSAAYVLEKTDQVEFADENFAREIMQLFSTGLVMLNDDGTPILNSKGRPQKVYSNADIRSVSRVWTGFLRQHRRGNIESSDGENRIDPMKINPEWHDRFPKSDLYGGFIGDGYPLCVDLPKRNFLRKGAKYRLLGSSPIPELMTDDERFKQRFVLSKKTSSLHSQLCNRKDDRCQYRQEVVLSKNLRCDGDECKVDTVRVVQVSSGIFYEYIQPPCVEHSFYSGAMKLNLRRDDEPAICGNPLLPIATSACCEEPDGYTDAISKNLYEIERMTFETQDARCRAMGRESCEYSRVDAGLESYQNNVVYHWAKTPCTLKLKVNPHGEIAVVHTMRRGDIKVRHVDESTTNFFKVQWDDGFPKASANSCGDCAVIDENCCLCETRVKETMVFSSVPRVTAQIVSALHIGAPDPESFDHGTYIPTVVNGFLTVHNKPSGLGPDTIFEVVDDTRRTRFLKNARSVVQVQGGFSFRNPVHFMSLIPSESNARDVMYEVDALLRHLLYHSNTPPFLCTRLIQRFGISNPSPRYVAQCSKAFRKGIYNSKGLAFGTKEYGDLAATVAAILLDREAFSSVLDADPSHGSIREPLLRVISLMRSMNFKPRPRDGVPTPWAIFKDMNVFIGQMAHESESVFSFFMSEYSPDGPVSAATLVAPEGRLLDMPKNINVINGLHSLIKYGLSSCAYGFGFDSQKITDRACIDDGKFAFSTGELKYQSQRSTSEGVVNELATLLTSGRLSAESRKAILREYEKSLFQVDAGAAVRVAQQLITATPEFHTTNTVKTSGKTREMLKLPSAADGHEYKAVVMLMLEGGCDSFNMLVPHQCLPHNGRADAYSRYAVARGSARLSRQNLLPIPSGGHAGCSSFGLHKELPSLQKLYKDKELLFFANAGILGKPTTKETFEIDTPTQLFAHNTLQREVRVLDVFNSASGTGVLGRLANALSISGKSVGSISIDTSSIALVGKQGVSDAPITLSHTGINRFMPIGSATMTKASMERAIGDLNNATEPDSGMMASTWSTSLLQSLFQNEKLYQALKATKVSHSFGESDLGKKFEIVAKLIKTRKVRGRNVDVFYLEHGTSWDHHTGLKDGLTKNFAELDAAVGSFVAELKSQGVYDSTTVFQVSDFGRTLTANSGGGTDHGWGGNYFMFGGSVKGGRILGEYPKDFSENGPLNLGRGRILPTTSFDQIWPAISQWSGVDKDKLLNRVCPNRGSFESHFESDKLFRTGGS